MTFDSVLIANRGEIAVRIIRTAREMGLRCIAIYTDTDRDAPHVDLADVSILLGDTENRAEPYLDGARIIDIARAEGAGAIHPGYGFLSENEGFAEACSDAGLVFIGPGSDAIRIMGDKAAGKAAMELVGVPCVPGYDGADQSEAALSTAASEIGLPLLIKAVAGGGGRGMRRVDHMDGFSEALASTRREAKSAFGSDQVILEKLMLDIRHIEVQVFGDTHGNVIHLAERDCSCQRRNQKVIEEAPAPFVSAQLRGQLGEAAINAAKAVDYVGAGTVEFLVAADDSFYFIEMNTRLQVEHPVTEAITGLDLVAWQFSVAMGEPLPLSQQEITLTGAAIEARLYAEDPSDGFLPQTGTIIGWYDPAGPGIRTDHMIRTGSHISARYDPMIAKIIAHGPSREIARQRLIAALENLQLSGLKTNKGFLLDCLGHEDFSAGRVTTGFVDKLLGEPAGGLSPVQAAIIAAVTYWQRVKEARATADDWSSLGPAHRQHDIVIDEDVKTFFIKQIDNISNVYNEDKTEHFELHLDIWEQGVVAAHSGTKRYPLNHWMDRGNQIFDLAGKFAAVARAATDPAVQGEQGGDQFVSAPMAGKIIAVETAAGDKVASGQTVIILEAMKMEHRIRSARDGITAALNVAIGDQVTKGDQLLKIGDEQL